MDKRPLNDFVHCECGVTYISGYLHCPKCGLNNEQATDIVSNEIWIEQEQLVRDREASTTSGLRDTSGESSCITGTYS